jgi:hypothetical protein
MFKKPRKSTISPSESAILNSTPALYSNKFYATMTTAGMKIVFTEIDSDKRISPRSGVVCSYPDARALYKLIQKMLRESDLDD